MTEAALNQTLQQLTAQVASLPEAVLQIARAHGITEVRHDSR